VLAKIGVDQSSFSPVDRLHETPVADAMLTRELCQGLGLGDTRRLSASEFRVRKALVPEHNLGTTCGDHTTTPQKFQ
jgi:hypothetical protein